MNDDGVDLELNTFFSSPRSFLLPTILFPIRKSRSVVVRSVVDGLLIVEVDLGEHRFDDDEETVGSDSRCFLFDVSCILACKLFSDPGGVRVRV